MGEYATGSRSMSCSSAGALTLGTACMPILNATDLTLWWRSVLYCDILIVVTTTMFQL